VTLNQLQASPIWVSGPSWLPDRSAWPQSESSGLKPAQILRLYATPPDPAPVPFLDIANIMDITCFNWTSLKRTTARVFRQSANFLQKAPSWISGPLTTKELLNGQIQWIHPFQHCYFAAKIEFLRDKKGRRPPLVTQLDLYLDGDYLIRCKGRLLNADIPQAARNPILQPKSSEISILVRQSFCRVSVRIILSTVTSWLSRIFIRSRWMGSALRLVMIGLWSLQK
jgi:hypothetical protein